MRKANANTNASLGKENARGLNPCLGVAFRGAKAARLISNEKCGKQMQIGTRECDASDANANAV
jgi:hypothetical protein